MKFSFINKRASKETSKQKKGDYGNEQKNSAGDDDDDGVERVL